MQIFGVNRFAEMCGPQYLTLPAARLPGTSSITSGKPSTIKIAIQ